MNDKGTKKRINISNKELDRDIINLHLEEIPLHDGKTLDECDYYSNEMKDYLKNREVRKKEKNQNKKNK